MSLKTLCRVASTALALAFLTGCSMLLAREVYEESPHVEQRNDDSDATDLVAASESSLKNAIIQMVRTGMTEGTIQLLRYQGDPKRDLLNAVAEVSNEEPIGKYAVYYMTYDLTQVLTNYHVLISIKYRCTPEQIESIMQTSGRTGLKDLLRETISSYEPVLTVEMPYYDETDYDPHALLRELYFENPGFALGYPELAVTLYPDNGLRRIAEIDLKYKYPQSVMLSRVDAVKRSAEKLVVLLPFERDDLRLILEIHDLLAENIDFDFDAEADARFTGKTRSGDAWTIYGALVLGRAVGEGYALAFKQLCDALSIPCRLVSGQLSGEEHVWNIVQAGGNWYHMDVAADDMEGAYSWFLRNDNDMRVDHHWDEADFVCETESVPVETIRKDAGVQPDTDDASPPPDGGEPDNP